MAASGVVLNSSDGASFSSSDAMQSQSISQVDSSQTAVENLEEYETQLFGFTPKSFVSGSKFLVFVFSEKCACILILFLFVL